MAGRLDGKVALVSDAARGQGRSHALRPAEELDRRIITAEADVRDQGSLDALVAEGASQFGRLDIVCANAGIATFAPNTWTIDDQGWDAMTGVNLTGVRRTVKAAAPAMIQAGNGGASC